MNFIRRPLAFTLALVCGGIFLAACQEATSDSRFAEMSQATMVLDSRGSGTGRTPMAWEGGGTPEGIGRTGGHYYYIRNREATRLFQPQRFAQGVTWDGRGKIVLRDGSIVRLSEGEMVTFAGDRLDLPPGTEFPEPTPSPLQRVGMQHR